MITARTRLRSFALAFPVAVALTSAPYLVRPAFAQGAAKPAPAKPAAKPDAKKAAEDAKAAEAAKAAEDAKRAEDAKKVEDAKAAEDAAKAAPAAAATTVEPPAEAWNITDVEELPGKRYIFVGARYRGNIIPKFMLNLFVDEGATIYSNTIGFEVDLRKDGFSFIPALSFTEYGTGDILFKEKNSKDIAGNYSFVNSSMKAIYATADLLWSAKLTKHLEFEYGAGFGVGVIFGDLANNWVYEDPNGAIRSGTGKNFSKCQAGGTQIGCNSSEHQGTDILKVGDYTEPSWLNGGSKPVIFPWISIPQVGLRYKPVKNFVARLGMGFSLTGFWFGLNGEYGLEQKPKP